MEEFGWVALEYCYRVAESFQGDPGEEPSERAPDLCRMCEQDAGSRQVVSGDSQIHNIMTGTRSICF